MQQRFHPRAMLDRLRSTYWFLPAIVTAAAAITAQLLVNLDRSASPSTLWLGWAYGGGADGARALLSAIAGSTITVVSVTFSVLVVALTVSSQHFGPRLLSNFMRDTPAQLVLGTFTGTFAYCLLVLRTVQGDGGDRFTFFVPHLAVTFGVVLTLFSVGMLIYYVHHVATAMQVSHITQGVARDLEHAIERLYPEPFGEGASPPRAALDPPAESRTITAVGSGYIQEVDSAAVIELAVKHRTTLWLLRRPGDFVVEGGAIAAVHPAPEDADALSDALAKAYVIGTDRTSRQDAAFAVQQLVEVGLRALSPGMNEPFTAVTCIDRLGQGLTKLLTRNIPSPVRIDDEGHTRFIAYPQTFGELAGAAFEPLALYAERNPEISARLLETLAALATRAQREEDRRAIASIADFVLTAGGAEVAADRHRARLRRAHERVWRALGGEASTRSNAAPAHGAAENEPADNEDPGAKQDRERSDTVDPRFEHDQDGHDDDQSRRSGVTPASADARGLRAS